MKYAFDSPDLSSYKPYKNGNEKIILAELK